ncbi:MAG: radical SAM protein [bacterium]|nr:radical SAM protein [bacterium]
MKKLLYKTTVFFRIVYTGIFRKRTPVVVRWNITDQCRGTCLYCNIPQKYDRGKELDTTSAISLIDSLRNASVKRLALAGGEIFCRDDIKEIVIHAKKKGISLDINTTGYNFESCTDILHFFELIKISLDSASEELNDTIRGKGAYGNATGLADYCTENGIKFLFTTTITKHNIHGIHEMLELAHKYGTVVSVQPLKPIYKGVTDITGIAPSKEDHQQLVNFLIEQKKGGKYRNNIRNSLSLLAFMQGWPEYPEFDSKDCSAGKLFCIIEADGRLRPCDRMDVNENSIENLNNGVDFLTAFKRLPPVECTGCSFCGAFELTELYNLRFSNIFHINRIQ